MFAQDRGGRSCGSLKGMTRFFDSTLADCMTGRLRSFCAMPLSRKMQACAFLWAKLKTRYLYRPRLQACGPDSIVLKPLFWTPESISIGSNVLIWPGCRIETVGVVGAAVAADQGVAAPKIDLGDGVTMQQNCHITAGGALVIGAGTTILCEALITDVDHRYEEFGRRVVDQPMTVVPTRIGRNCFIGAGARILAGTILGDSCVVGANSVIRGNYPSGVVIAGVPGRVVKRFDVDSREWIRADRG